jgi:hypothetical protein
MNFSTLWIWNLMKNWPEFNENNKWVVDRSEESGKMKRGAQVKARLRNRHFKEQRWRVFQWYCHLCLVLALLFYCPYCLCLGVQETKKSKSEPKFLLSPLSIKSLVSFNFELYLVHREMTSIVLELVLGDSHLNS